MSSQLSKDYVVKVDGPINILGAMRRKGDPVTLSPVEAKAYAPFVKKAPKPKEDGIKGAPAK